MSVSPGYNLGVLLNGNEANPDLGLLDQPTTFLNSLQRFASGPIAPDGRSPVDTTAPGGASGLTPTESTGTCAHAQVPVFFVGA